MFKREAIVQVFLCKHIVLENFRLTASESTHDNMQSEQLWYHDTLKTTLKKICSLKFANFTGAHPWQGPISIKLQIGRKTTLKKELFSNEVKEIFQNVAHLSLTFSRHLALGTKLSVLDRI